MIRNVILLLASLACVCIVASPTAHAESQHLRAVPFDQVTVEDPFWSSRLTANRTVTAGHVLDECERTGRIANFRVAGEILAKGTPSNARRKGGMRGIFFNDSDVYKAIEGCGYLLATDRDATLEARCDAIIEAIASAQEPDGYLYTSRTILDPDNMPPGGPKRWSDMGGGHELYCAGHLYEAAVAYHAATGKTRLLDVARKHAALVAATFGAGADQHPCGHPEVEIGLAKLYNATGDNNLLDLLRFLIDTRGRADRGRPLYGEYAQDHVPVLEQHEAVGHAVRLAYLQSGLVELARLTGDDRYLQASESVWEDIVARKMYLTGGIGSQGNNEGFGLPYELANGSAYNETCAAIAFIQWNHRLFLATGEARYIDILERTLHNAMLAGWSLSGSRFFYPNPLETSHGLERVPWFDCACCPPNVLRFIASMPQFAYATDERDLYVNLFLGGRAETTVAGVPVVVEQRGKMPFDADTSLSLRPATPVEFAFRIRIPGWARGEVVPSELYRPEGTPPETPLRISVNGEPVTFETIRGYAVLRRKWTAGDRVDLRLAMPIMTVRADERVTADRGRVAFVRGPLTYCVESVDIGGASPLGAVLDGDAWRIGAPIEALGAAPTLLGRLRPVERALDGGIRVGDPFEARAIPYALWANRDRGAMAVWLAKDPAAAKPAPAPTIARRAKASSSFGGDLASLSDQLEPASSGDHEHPFLHWWPRMGTKETITYEFAEAAEVRAVEVYWFDDTGRGACRLPVSWTLEARRDGQWMPVENPSGFGVLGDRYNRCEFEAIRADALRISVQSQKNFAGGIHEWRIESTADVAGGRAIDGAASAIRNAGFEEASGSEPSGWSRSVWGAAGGDDGVRFTVGEKGRNGSAVGLGSAAGADAAWSQTVSVEPWSLYRLRGWIRTEGVAPLAGAAGALLNLHGLPVRTPALTGTTGWTEVSTEFESADNDAVTVNCLFGGWGLATGSAWFDDVRLELLTKGSAPQPFVAIDASKVGEPISPYIYGQFIEHLGRCIYGGIWAEMLEDRKFFDRVNEPSSPWRVAGAAHVVMSEEGAFVGAHSPAVRASAAGDGIVQSKLAAEAGREYVGHLWVAGDASAAPLVVSFGDATPMTITSLHPDWTRAELRFVTTKSDANAAFSILSGGAGTFRVGTASLMPADNISGFRADTLALLRELDAPVYRWPGGNFVSGYDWRDGIGERDRRPPRKNPAWSGIEHNDVGIHEFLELCDLLHTEPYVAINTGLGSIENAVAELAYVNGDPTGAMDRLRAANGRSDPWKVRFWGIGNEMYGSWQLGNVPLTEYTKRHNAFVDALRAVDPSIHAIAVGAAGEWSRTMLRDCADHMSSMSEHVYWQERPGLLAHVRQAPDSLRAIADAHRHYRAELPNLKGHDIRIVQDEWNYWYGPHVFGELGTRYFMRDALGCAAALNEFARNSDFFFMANYAQTVNVIGAIKTTPTKAAMETTGEVLALYRHELGILPCATRTSPAIDAVATWSADRAELRIAIVNASRAAAEVRLELSGATLGRSGRRWEIAHPDPMAFNDPDRGERIVRRATLVTFSGHSLSVAPCSVTLFAFPAEPQ